MIMKINITAVSSYGKNKIIEVDSIDEAINKLRTDKELVKSVVDERYTWLSDSFIPETFIIEKCTKEEYDYEIQIYDFYTE